MVNKKCLRCGHKWVPRVEKPVSCPICKSPKWAQHKTNKLMFPDKVKVKSLLTYNATNGVFSWKIKRKGVKANKQAGSVIRGHYIITIDGAQIRALDIAWMMMLGSWPTVHIEPLDGVKTNASALNLYEPEE